MKNRLAFVLIPTLLTLPSIGQGSIVSATSSDTLNRIIPVPTSVVDDRPGAENAYQQGFDEAQNITLTSDLQVDNGVIPAGTVVSSHMIFLNSPSTYRKQDKNIDWVFDGKILGVMSDYYGRLEKASDAQLGAPGTIYPLPFIARGLEGSDVYQIIGNTLRISMYVAEPGDWVRVVTEASGTSQGSSTQTTAATPNPVSDTIVNLNARTTQTTTPVTVYLDAGNYTVTPISPAQGGLYTAWNPWGKWISSGEGCLADGSGCTKGFVSNYYLSGDFGSVSQGNGRWLTADLALANAGARTFTLSKPSQVNFYVRDSVYTDNTGGISLHVSGTAISQPKVNFALDQVVGEGNTFNLTATLDGPANSYPVVIPFSVGSNSTATDSTDSNVTSGEIVINSGTSGSVEFQTYDDNVIEGDETLEIVMGSLQNTTAGTHTVQKVTITDSNVAPRVDISISQNGKATRTIDPKLGDVQIAINVDDANSGDNHVFDWSLTDQAISNRLSNVSNDIVSFDPRDLAPGIYKVGLRVTDDGVPAASTSADLSLNVIVPPSVETETIVTDETLMTGTTANSTTGDSPVADSDHDGVADNEEDAGDDDGDGVPNIVDNRNYSENELQSRNCAHGTGCEAGKRADTKDRNSNASDFVMQTEHGLKLTLGEVSFASGNYGAEVTDEDIEKTVGSKGGYEKDSYKNVGGLYDFEVHGLKKAGMSSKIVIPLTAQIPADAVYRKFIPGQGWRDFVIDKNNQVASASGSLGVCPPAGDAAYKKGLAEGDYCIELTIEDGGLNDADGEANYTVKDPGGVATIDRSASTPAPSNSTASASGGGGSLGIAEIALLIVMGLRIPGPVGRRRRSGI
jgi:hypothetical protein